MATIQHYWHLNQHKRNNDGGSSCSEPEEPEIGIAATQFAPLTSKADKEINNKKHSMVFHTTPRIHLFTYAMMWLLFDFSFNKKILRENYFQKSFSFIILMLQTLHFIRIAQTCSQT